jgi:hypothetical protein
MHNAESKVKVHGCTFLANLAGEAGGGVHNIAKCRPVFTDCTFEGNSAGSFGGAMHNVIGGPLMVMAHNCVFYDNTADEGGGAVANTQYGGAIFTGCKFLKNGADRGGGIYSDNGDLALFGCLFVGNRAGTGGGVRAVGLVRSVSANCVFTGNSARSGGAFLDEGGEATLVNCTLVSNSATADTGGGIWSGDKIALVNSILWANSHDGDGNEQAQIRLGGKTIATVNHCCIQGWSGRLPGVKNSGIDPLFLDHDGPDNEPGTLDDNLRLSLESPCRDVGDDDALASDTFDLDFDGRTDDPVEVDVDGRPRIAGDRIDLGAYEGP